MSKPKLLITRRWPKAVEEAAMGHFDVTLNDKDIPLGIEDMRDALKSYDAISPTVTDVLNFFAILIVLIISSSSVGITTICGIN